MHYMYKLIGKRIMYFLIRNFIYVNIVCYFQCYSIKIRKRTRQIKQPKTLYLLYKSLVLENSFRKFFDFSKSVCLC